MSHPTFESAGSEPGTEIWTIENFEPVPIDVKQYGKFYNGDTYIVLKTSGTTNSPLCYDVHFWLGGHASQDKVGAAALWTVTLDDALGGHAVHHREVQAHESALFLGYFKPAIRYLEGGNESGFTEVETNAGAERRLLKLKGADNMRIEEVPAEASSLCSTHCFLLEVDHDIFALVADGAKATQRRKLISVANSLRDDYHNGRATIEIIDEFSPDEDYEAFFAAVGSGSRADLQADDSTETYARDDISAVYLYRVTLGDQLDLVALSKPYSQRHLSSDEVYILDTPDSGVYVWLGSRVDADVKRGYSALASQVLAIKGYPDWVNVTRVTEGAESATFAQYFHDWQTISSSSKTLLSEADAGYFSGDAEESAAAARLIGRSAAARGFMPDGGDGTLLVTRISEEEEDVTDIFTSGAPALHQGAAYVLTYTCEGGEDIIYVWIGAAAPPPARASARGLAARLEAERGDSAAAVTIPQGCETKHFLSLFKGTLAILFGSKEDEFRAQNANGTYDEDGIRLFKVWGTTPGVDTRALQVPEGPPGAAGAALSEDDVFVLETPEVVYVWNGKDSSAGEAEAGLAFAERVAAGRELVSVSSGEEPDQFWDALGGAPSEPAEEATPAWKQSASRRAATPVTLTAVTVTVTGRVLFEDLDTEYSQQDLSEDGVYILDSGEELYLWQGRSAPARTTAAREDIVKEYISDDGLGRTADSALVIALRQGAEPAAFRRLFAAWDADMWDNLESYEDIKNETKAANCK